MIRLELYASTRVVALIIEIGLVHGEGVFGASPFIVLYINRVY